MMTPASVPPSVGPPSGPASGAPASAAEPESTAPPSPEPPSGGTTLDSFRSLPPPPQATPMAMAAATAAGPTHRQPERMPCLPPRPLRSRGRASGRAPTAEKTWEIPFSPVGTNRAGRGRLAPRIETFVRHRGPHASRQSDAALLFTPAMDAEACYRAVEGRDARFAGRFFLGVRTTNIYCRPGCPARVPRRENVTFFPSAAAAQAAGFRACLRCRPDAAPGSPAQAGTAATLSRALRLLEESGDAAGLADRLGMTDRHLRRLFARHLGASPAEVLRTRRLHLARQLLETSSLRIIDVAHAAGFQSLRRFNEAVRRGFGRTPSQLRTLPEAPGAALTLRLPFHPPLDFEALLAFFAARALPGLEEAGDGAWRRRLPEGWLEVVRDGPAHLQARMPAALAPRALSIAARIRRVFDLRADPAPIAEHLARDPVLKPYLRPGLRIPGAWDPFEMAVRAVLGQQISVQRARAMAAELI